MAACPSRARLSEGDSYALEASLVADAGKCQLIPAGMQRATCNVQIALENVRTARPERAEESGQHMATRQELLEHLWKEVINAHLRPAALDNIVGNSKRDPDGPFAATGLSRATRIGTSARHPPARHFSARVALYAIGQAAGLCVRTGGCPKKRRVLIGSLGAERWARSCARTTGRRHRSARLKHGLRACE